MGKYNQSFARMYNENYGFYANAVSVQIADRYAAHPHGEQRQPVLDLCCGTGQLARKLLEKGYRVTGLDLSGDMLYYAAKQAEEYIKNGSASFVQGDATSFDLGQGFGLVVSTFDALNHIPTLAQLGQCFACAHKALLPGGLFIFDIMTRKGFNQRRNTMNVTEDADKMILFRGVYDGEGPMGMIKFSGFSRNEEGFFERFDETISYYMYPMEAVKSQLLQAGFQSVQLLRETDLKTEAADPESEARIFFMATR